MYRPARRVLIIKLAFVAVFAVLSGWLWWHQLNVVKPRNACLSHPGAQWVAQSRTCKIPPGSACEAAGDWWDPVSKTCAHVVHIPDILNRK